MPGVVRIIKTESTVVVARGGAGGGGVFNGNGVFLWEDRVLEGDGGEGHITR